MSQLSAASIIYLNAAPCCKSFTEILQDDLILIEFGDSVVLEQFTIGNNRSIQTMSQRE